MRELRIGTWLAAMTALVAWGCDGSRPADPDSGMVTVDSGGGGIDSGPPRDSGPDTGMTTMTDSGMTGPSCGPTDGACDVSNPSSCGGGMACVVRKDPDTDVVSTYCVAAGTGTDGAACDPMMTQCAEGFDCSQFENVCRRVCCSNSDCNPTDTGQNCNIFSDSGPAGRMSGICLLPDTCNPADGSGCDAGQSCYINGPENLCVATGTVATGEPCGGSAGRCAAGNACLGADGEAATCRKLCDLMMDGAGCATEEVCNGRIGLEGGGQRTDVGFCVPMTTP